MIHGWAMECSFDFSYGKCCYTNFPPKITLGYKPSVPNRMEGNRIALRWNILFFSVTIDAHLSWMPYLTSVQEKAVKVVHKMNCLTAANWVLKPKLCKMLYAIMLERIILYAPPISHNGKVV